MTLPFETMRRIRSVLTIIIFFTLVGTTYEFMDMGQVTLAGPVIGFVLGLVFGVFEAFIFAHKLRGLPFAVTILVKTCTYVIVITLIFMSAGFVVGSLQGLTMDDFVEDITSRAFWGKIGVVFALFLSVIFFIERIRLDAENERKELELEKARELEQAYGALEESHRHLKTAQAQLIQSEKMASLGRLAAGIAHEIKNPLNFVNNFAKLNAELADELAQELEANENKKIAEVSASFHELLSDLKENARRINEHGHRADGIVRSMLEHFRTQPGQRHLVDVNALLDEYVNLAYHGMQAKEPDFIVEIARNYDDSVDQIELEPREIGRVFLNLLDNAFYATHEKARTVEGPYTPRVTVSTHQLDDQIKVCVKDNGPGIPHEVINKVFEPFFTTKPTGMGTGLGLSISYDIITQGHGGTLSLDSTQDEGTVFVFTLSHEAQAPEQPENWPINSRINHQN